MAELPQVPNLNLNPDGTEAPPEPAADAAASTPAAPAEPATADDAVEEVDIGEGDAAPADEAVGAAGAPLPAVPASAPPGRDTLHENVEEMLNQASEQSVRMVHLEEVVSQLSSLVGDLREEMHAGLTETRHAAEDTATAESGELRRTVASRLDEVESITGRIARKQGRQLMIGVLQVLLLLALGAIIMFTTGDVKPPRLDTSPRTPTPEVSSYPELKSGEPAMPSATETAAPAKKKKKKRKR